MYFMRINKLPFTQKNYEEYLIRELNFVELKFLENIIGSDDNIDIAFNTTMFKTYTVFDNRYNQVNRFLCREYKIFRLFIIALILSLRNLKKNTNIILAYKKHIYYFRIDNKNDLLIGEYRCFSEETKEFVGQGFKIYHIFPLNGAINVYDIFYNIMKYVNRNLF